MVYLPFNVEGHYAIIIGLIVRLYESKRKIEIIVGVKIRLPVLTASVFETGAMAAPTILENPTVLGQGDPASTQWSHPSRFCHWALCLATMATLHLRAVHKTTLCFPTVIFIFCQPRLKKTI